MLKRLLTSAGLGDVPFNIEPFDGEEAMLDHVTGWHRSNTHSPQAAVNAEDLAAGRYVSRSGWLARKNGTDERGWVPSEERASVPKAPASPEPPAGLGSLEADFEALRAKLQGQTAAELDEES